MNIIYLLIVSRPHYMSLVPNGNINGRSTGHTGDYSNEFRELFIEEKLQWTRKLCEIDSDQDGQTNGLELGDPCCIWKIGDTPQYITDISLPGDRNTITLREKPSCLSPDPTLPPLTPPTLPQSPSYPPPVSPPPQTYSSPSSPTISQMQCDRAADFILIGSGAGGTPAAAMLRNLDVDFIWVEAGYDVSWRLQQYNYTDDRHKPQSQNMWHKDERPKLKRDMDIVMDYAIPKTAGGQTSHYAGVNYWTLSDTISSTQIRPSEMEVLEFIKNTTLKEGVRCDEFDPRYHTHERHNIDPNTEDEIMVTNACMYGQCKGSNCELNKLFVSSYSLDAEKNAISDWYLGSTITEYGADKIETGVKVQKLLVENGNVSGVHVLINESISQNLCAKKAVLLAAGVMGNAEILLPHVTDYKIYGQPYIPYYDNELMGFTGSNERCDDNTISGGVFVKLPKNGSGFISTLGICKKNNTTRILWATPQAVNDKIYGIMHYDKNQNIVAEMNYDTNVLDDLKNDFRNAVMEIYNISIDTSIFQFLDGGYHWTGHRDLITGSKVNNFTNLYLADALAVVGKTSGWTSWNTRVAGGLAAYRAVKSFTKTCDEIRSDHITLDCCAANVETCDDIRQDFIQSGCCEKN